MGTRLAMATRTNVRHCAFPSNGRTSVVVSLARLLSGRCVCRTRLRRATTGRVANVHEAEK